MRIVVDKKACCGHAMCNSLAPDVYVLDDDGYNQMEPFEIEDPALAEQARVGAAACPEYAITIQE
jgi:ferredoxin